MKRSPFLLLTLGFIWTCTTKDSPTEPLANHLGPSFDLVSYDCSSQTQILPSECEALVAFFNSIGGPGWEHKDGWLETSTPCSWSGVTCSETSVDELYSVSELYFSFNQLAGQIPAEVASLSNLQALTIRGNLALLTGPIPPELGSLSNLQELNLDSNQLTGPIPAELGSLSNLQELRLSRNQLTGPIPVEFGQPKQPATAVARGKPADFDPARTGQPQQPECSFLSGRTN